MTDSSHSPSTPDALRDPHIDALWRKASNEEPPAAIDDALLALARRESGAGPRHLRVAEAMRPGRWWWPLATAAVIGAVVIGLLPLISNDISEQDRDTDSPQRLSATQAVRTDSVAEAPKLENAEKQTERNADVEQMKRSGIEQERKRQSARDAPPASPAPTSHATSRNERAESAPSSMRENASATPPAVAMPQATPALRDQAEVAVGGAKEPLVADDKRKDEAKKKDEAPASPVAGAPSAFARNSMDATSAASVGQAASSVGQTTSEVRNKPMESAPPARVLASPSGSLSNVVPAAPLAKTHAEEGSYRALEKGVAPDVAEWIVRMRRLREQGRIEEAKKELAAFRETHPDAERLLPPELRDWVLAKP